ncbi:type II secretion system protein GspC [Motilimonas pumila]|uniref:Type II secretion system protein GspC n=1 Tax=Motilimonas pumila TaxID=2303987 RepID=A0A418YKW6_9GAMM|nr:type II secretion system protein GspC [Motilimonas pumila]RJG51622.1 type II secretion system protein GspC [Motilimonas pumila]
MDKLSEALKRLNSLPQQKLSSIAFMTLLLLLCYQMANLTWLLMPTPEQKAAPWRPEPVRTTQSSQRFDVAALRSINMFGVFNQQKAAPKKATNTPAPKTRLNLKLTGLLASTVPANAIAIIEERGSQNTYFIGSKIARTGAVLKEIYKDRVIIEYNGKRETLMLDGESYNKKPARQPSQANKRNLSRPMPASQRKKIDVGVSREELLSDPGKITDYIAISPVRKQGVLMGYRVNPGKKSKLFKAAGLQPNDLAVALNGIDLTDLQQSMALMQQLPQMTDITLSVERAGQLHELYFSLPE